MAPVSMLEIELAEPVLHGNGFIELANVLRMVKFVENNISKRYVGAF